MKYEDITQKIIASAIHKHKILGNGFQEVIYQRCMAVTMEKIGLRFARELEQTIFFEDVNVGTRRVDFLVEEKILVELKAINTLEDVHLGQAINYLEAYRMEVCLLINFGSRRIQFKRLNNRKLISKE